MGIAAWSGVLLDWEAELAGLKARRAPIFGRKELKATASAFLDGLLSGVARKTGWQMAEQAGLDRPNRMQSLLGRGIWDEDALRDDVRAYVIEALGGSRWRARRRRNRFCEEGRAFRRRGEAIFGRGRAD